ncbi:hypothetical protein Tco_0857825 [Tanacetum coccineum]|uniref:Reverse transcriptase domain-containing protein n=1 Tax=Tanacetum coccineum TaxID=301880 RepID=A0ABQ5BAD6_9ASTR
MSKSKGRGFLATANAVIKCRMAKIAVGEGITREWEIARDAEINPFKDVPVFRRRKRIFKKRNKKKAKHKQIQARKEKGQSRDQACELPQKVFLPAPQNPVTNCACRTRSQLSSTSNKLPQQQVPPNLVELPIVTMADNRTMAELLQAPTEGYEDAIVVPEIETANFE